MGLKYSPAAEMRFQSLTLFLVNLAGIMERADESLLPGVYKEVGAALETDPTGLGSLTLFRSIVQSSCYPLAAYLSIRHNRTHVIALGAFLWAAATFLVGMSSTFAQVAVSRGLNGIGLAIVTPAIQSLVADSTEDSNRGTAFGWLQLTGNFGSIIGGLLALLLASTSVFGISGWRIAFHIVGLISVVVGLLVGLFAKDPRFFGSDGEPKQQPPPKSFKTEIKDMVKEAKAVVKIPSFQILIAQGVAGSFPWSGLSFAPMWLELKGFSHETTAVLWTIFAVAQCVGSLFGGKMGDVLAKPFPNGGRIILSQVSAGSVIPLAAILLLALPNDASSPFSHGLVLVIMGFTSSWNAPATNNPIFAEIVPERARTSIYAWDQSFESILASFAPPIVGFLAQHVYGFKPQRNSTSSSSSENTITNRENAASLAKALYPAIGIPMVICVFFYSFLYCTYPRDRDRAKMDALIESEMQQIDMDSTHSKEDQYIRVVDASEYDDAILHLNEKSGIDVDCEENDELEFENDEKKLLSHQTSFKANNT